METIRINNTVLEFDKIIYVDAINGNDIIGDGTRNKPYKTLQTAIDNCNENYAIKLSDGIFTIHGFNDLLQKHNITYIGNNKTVIEIEANQTLNINPVSSFYKIIFRPCKNYIDEAQRGFKSILYGGHTTIRTWNMLFYNCVFEDPYDVLVKGQRHCSYIYADTSSYVYHIYENLKFINCIALDTPMVSTWYDPTTKSIQVVNCATNYRSLINPNGESDHSRNVEVITSLTNAFFDEKYNITSEGWRNTGTGTNPDGTQAHIGVYGGEFAWRNWKILLKSNNKYYTYRNNEFIEVEPTVENFKGKSIYLPDLTTPTDRVVLTMEGEEELENGRLYRKTIVISKYKDTKRIGVNRGE